MVRILARIIRIVITIIKRQYFEEKISRN